MTGLYYNKLITMSYPSYSLTPTHSNVVWIVYVAHCTESGALRRRHCLRLNSPDLVYPDYNPQTKGEVL